MLGERKGRHLLTVNSIGLYLLDCGSVIFGGLPAGTTGYELLRVVSLHIDIPGPAWAQVSSVLQ